MQKAANVAKNIKSSGNISIRKPTSQSLVYEKSNENGKYGPFNFTYPSYASTASGKYEFVGDNFEILVNGKKLSYLPESGTDFYLTEADGIILGEENTVKITYKGKYNFRGTGTRYTGERTLIADVMCAGCGETYERD